MYGAFKAEILRESTFSKRRHKRTINNYYSSPHGL